MPERSLEGIQITETPGAEQPIARASAHVTAFVGRTLRGPIDRPILIQSFADFQQQFGGLWQPSPLSYSVEHFFEQAGAGDRRSCREWCGARHAFLAVCTRDVANRSARQAARIPRASIDYDHSKRRRAALQPRRAGVRAPGSERIEARRLFARCRSIGVAALRCGALLESNWCVSAAPSVGGPTAR